MQFVPVSLVLIADSVRSRPGKCQNLPLVDFVDLGKGFVLTGVKDRAVLE